MVTLTVTNPTEIFRDVAKRQIVYEDAVIANNAVHNDIVWTVPSDINPDSYLIALAITTTGAATFPTPLSFGERVLLIVFRGGMTQCTVIPSRETMAYYISGTAGASGWIATFRREELIIPAIQASDSIQVSCPPPDDDATPTGDYVIRLTLQERGT